MYNRKDILIDYLHTSKKMDLTNEILDSLNKLDKPSKDFKIRVDNLKKQLDDLEKANPWIASVLVAIKGN
jgi:uncharacterized membrane protein